MSLSVTENQRLTNTFVLRTEEMCSLLVLYAVDGEELIPDPQIVTIPKEEADSFPKSDPGWRFYYY